MDLATSLRPIIMSLVFALIGMLVFVCGFYTFDHITPYSLWKQVVEEKNVALAIVVGAVSIGLSMIISAAIHG